MKNSIAAICCVVSSAASAAAVHIFWKEKHKREMYELRKTLNDIYQERLDEMKRQAKIKEASKTEEQRKLNTTPPAEREKTEMEEAVENENITLLKPEEYGDDPDFARWTYRYYAESDCFVNPDYDLAVDADEVRDTVGDNIEELLGESDEIFIRNWNLKADIAVYRCDGSYDYVE